MSELPSGWAMASLKQVAAFVTDGDHNPPRRVREGVPHLTARNVKGGHLVLDGCTFISHEDFAKVSRRYAPLPGDVIVTCVGTLGQTAIVPEGLTFSADRNLAAIRPNEAMLSSFLKAALDAPGPQTVMQSASGSTAQPHLYLGDLRELTIPVPPLAEQRRIVAIIEGYSGHSIEVQSDYRRDGRCECFYRTPVVGVHDPPGLEVRDYLLDHPANLVDLCVELLLPVQ